MSIRTVLPVVIVAVLASCGHRSPDATGTWAGAGTDETGGSIPLVLDLTVSGASLAGSVTVPDEGRTLAIEHGAIAGSRLAFDLSSPGPEDTNRFHVAATLDGEQMHGLITDSKHDVSMPFTLSRGAAGGRAGRRTVRATDDTGPPNPQGPDPRPEPAVPAILAAFDKHEVVALGILSYANQDFDQLILSLIRNPELPTRVNDIVVECGNSLYQPVLDRYIAGDDVALAEARQAWRNTTQPMCGLAAFYDEFFPLVRQINQGLPPAKRLRVLAGDPPVDWSRVRNPKDMRGHFVRDASIAGVMESQVLARHRKALMIFGIRHLMHGGGGAVGRYERKLGNKDATYVVMAHNGFGNRSPLTRYNDTLERRLAGWPVPSLAGIAGTWLADLGYQFYFPDDQGRHDDIAPRVDAYLYLGPRALLLNEPLATNAVLDSAYLQELTRRATIMGHPTSPAEFLSRAVDSTVFFNEGAEVARDPQ